MSTPTTTPSTTATPSAGAAHGPGGVRKGAAGADLFANLLALVGDTRLGGGLSADALAADPALSDSLAEDALLPGDIDAAAGDNADNPLTQLLSWSYPSGLGDLSHLASGKGLGQAAGEAGEATRPGSGPALITPRSLQTADSRRSAPGIDISGLGLVAVAPGESTDADASVWLARNLAASAAPIPAKGPDSQAIDRAATTVQAPASQDASSASQRLAAALPPLRASVSAEPIARPSTEPLASASQEKGRKAGPSVTATLQARDAASNDTARLQQQLVAASSRSTVALDGRSNPTGFRMPTPEVVATTATMVVAGGPRTATSSRTAMTENFTGSLADPASSAIATAKPSEPSLRAEGDASSPQAQAAELETPGHLGAHTLRHASLRVGDGSAEAIDVQLSITGQEVQVDFRSDSAETRHGLQQSAAPALGELLERSGMQLGSVSVGGQGLASGGGQGAGAGAGGERRSPQRDARATGSAEPLAPAVARPRADGSRPLDVFA